MTGAAARARPAPSVARGAALATLATAVSRVTGFVRVMVVAAAMGTTFLANTYQTANTAPNIVFELVAAGVLSSIFVPTFVEYLVRGDPDEGWNAADALMSVALIGLVALALLVGLAAPLIMRFLTLGVADRVLREQEIALGSTFLRLFAPQVVFYGAGMIMTGALHAHRRFGLAAAAPIFNNIVVIATYLAYAAMRGARPPEVGTITIAETLVLGVGTTLGVAVMTLVLVPQLARLGWRFHWRPDRSHEAVRRGARLGVWALGYAGGYQAGLIVVIALANAIEGGVAAYQWAYTFFYLPHALFAVPLFNALFTTMSERIATGDEAGMAERLQGGLQMLAFILMPLAAVLLVCAEPLSITTLRFGVMTAEGASLVGRVIAAFSVGLPAYSAFLVVTRAFYARGDTKTPALVNAATVLLSSGLGAALFAAATPRWSIAGLALGHSVGFSVGAGLLLRALARQQSGPVWGSALRRSAVRSLAATAAALAMMVVVTAALEHSSKLQAVVDVAVTAATGGIVYLGVMAALRAPELARLAGVLRKKPA